MTGVSYSDEDIVKKWYPVLEANNVPDDERLVVSRTCEALAVAARSPLGAGSQRAIKDTFAFLSKLSQFEAEPSAN